MPGAAEFVDGNEHLTIQGVHRQACNQGVWQSLGDIWGAPSNSLIESVVFGAHLEA